MLSDNTNTELENIKQIISSLVEECRYCVQASGTIVEDNANIEELNAMMHGVSEMAEHMNNESDGLKEALSFFNN